MLTLYGLPESVYTRIALLILQEKQLPYDLVVTNVFDDVIDPVYLQLNPFYKIPTLVDNHHVIYETQAIALFLDNLAQPLLQPMDHLQRVRLQQLLGILDHYAYPQFISALFVERVCHPAEGITCNETLINAVLPKIKATLQAIESLISDGAFMVSNQLTLADLYAAPIFYYLLATPEGKDLLPQFKRLTHWWRKIAERQSVQTICTPYTGE